MLTDKLIIDNNSLISEFLGFKKELFYQCSPDEDKSVWQDKDFGFYDLPFSGGYDMAGKEGVWFAQTQLKFHSDWNWLMPVIKKIESMGFYVSIMKSNITCCKDGGISPVFEEYDYNDKLETTWLAVTAFIKWYNKQ